MKKILELINLNKQFSNTTNKAVENVSFELKKAEILVLVGESGCGKTTLLRLIAGLEEPDSGKIIFENQLVLPPSQKLIAGHPKITMVFQDFQLFPHHTVMDNIAYVLRTYPLAFQEKQLAKMLKINQLSSLQNKLPRQLSGGQKQRVALARALASEPSLVLLDEPFSNLDSFFKHRLSQELRQIIQKTKTTALLVTHDTREALAIADRIVVMQNGKILQIDSPQNIYEKPHNPYVAELFGEMNWLSPDFSEKNFQIKTNKIAGIRPENIEIQTLNQNSLQGKITEKYYFGTHYQYKISLDTKTQLSCYSTDNQLLINDWVSLKINLEKLIYF